MFRLFYLITFLLLAGCGTKIIEKKVYVPFSLEQTLMTRVTEPPPPDKESYLASTAPEQRRILAGLLMDNMEALQMCNAKLYSIGDVYKAHTERVKVMNSEKKD